MVDDLLNIETLSSIVSEAVEKTGAPELALTVMTHPEPDLIGWCSRAFQGVVRVSRSEPLFAGPGGIGDSALMVPAVSRTPFLLEPLVDGGLRVYRGSCQGKIDIDGTPLETEHPVSPQRLQNGVVLQLSAQVVLLLHPVAPVSLRDLPAMGMIGHSRALALAKAELLRLSRLDVSVLIRGETGSGKELAAQALHRLGKRAANPFVAVNMAALTPTLAASELFGVHKGAFSGADQHRLGFFRSAQGGTLFLDEIGETPLEVQTVLLRVLETREVRAVGAPRAVPVDLRLLAATDAALEKLIGEGLFKEPLYHRLAGYEVTIPPLRHRRADIPLLFRHFAKETIGELGLDRPLRPRSPSGLPWLRAATASWLLDNPWSGNIREFRNVVRKMIIAAEGEGLHPPRQTTGETGGVRMHQRAESRRDAVRPTARRRPADVGEAELAEAMAGCGWDPKQAAKALGISRTSIYDLLKKTPGLRTAADLTPEEIADCYRAHDGDPAAMAMSLRVARSALERRLKAMGW